MHELSSFITLNGFLALILLYDAIIIGGKSVYCHICLYIYIIIRKFVV